jgi:hypothetical protein
MRPELSVLLCYVLVSRSALFAARNGFTGAFLPDLISDERPRRCTQSKDNIV